jgi:hypothetical protein
MFSRSGLEDMDWIPPAWYGHVQGMAEGRLPKISLKWRALERPKQNCMECVREAMNERNLKEVQWEDRKQWILGVGTT